MQLRTEQAYDGLREELRHPAGFKATTRPRLRGWLVGASWAFLWTVVAMIWGIVNPASVSVFAPAGLFMGIGLSGACARAAFDAGEEAAVCAALFSIAVTQFWGAQETVMRTVVHDVYWVIMALITIVLISGFGPVLRRVKRLVTRRAGVPGILRRSLSQSSLFPAE